MLASDEIATLTNVAAGQVSHDPPLVSVSFSASAGGEKDSCANIRATREFTVSIISEPFADAANATCVAAPPEIDEFALSGLTPEPSVRISSPPPLARAPTLSRTARTDARQAVPRARERGQPRVRGASAAPLPRVRPRR